MTGWTYVVRKLVDHEFLDGLEAFLVRPPIVLPRPLRPTRIVSFKPKRHWLDRLLADDAFDDDLGWW